MERVVLVTLTAAEQRDRLREGANFVNSQDPDDPVVVYVRDGRILKAYRNRCQHQHGRFLKCPPATTTKPTSTATTAVTGDIEDCAMAMVKCTQHGWTMNVATGEYVNPPDTFHQPPLLVEYENNNNENDNGGGTGTVRLIEERPAAPWLPRQVPRAIQLAEHEFTVRYWTHACIEIAAGSRRILCDPWLTGPAFGRGWWLVHRPPYDDGSINGGGEGGGGDNNNGWVEYIAQNIDAIYVSHSHPDHLSVPTLRRIAARRPDLPVYVGDLSEPVFSKTKLEETGLTDVRVVELGTWQDLGGGDNDRDNDNDHNDNDDNANGCRFMILGDGAMPELDTMVLVEYRGWRLVNFVDCNSPSSLHLPRPVDVALGDFACGSSGFPACFADTFGERRVLELANSKRRKFLNKVAKQVALVGAPWYVPVAGSFTEHPRYDPDILRLNRKNTPAEVAAFVRDKLGIQTWIPFPGGTFDIGMQRGDDRPNEEDEQQLMTEWDDEPYVEEIRRVARSHDRLDDIPGVARYFEWAGLVDYDYVLHIVESSDDFSSIERQYLVDFGGPEVAVREVASRELLDAAAPIVGSLLGKPGRPYERLRVRADVLRYVMTTGGSWDDIYIGFQGRYKVDPGLYHHKFHQHFRHLLPQGRPDL